MKNKLLGIFVVLLISAAVLFVSAIIAGKFGSNKPRSFDERIDSEFN